TVHSVEAAFGALAVKKKIATNEALALRYLLDGLSPGEVSKLSQLPQNKLKPAADALKKIDDIPLATALCRSSLSLTELGRAKKISANAINLRVNRLRLKVWQALCDRAYETLRTRQNGITAIDKAIVQYRCEAQNNPPCKMYKDRSCKREASLETIISKAGLNLTPEQLGDHMAKLRDTLLDDLGRIFPDYNACLFERKAAE
ncbi:MAG: hypothetical protein P1V97_29700, partial [Planctomycetota bacterium]|nr:hypothetical protein [Planctomycetota bacterium]